MYTIILRRVNRMKIFVFVYIRRLGSLVAQGIGGIDRSCFGTRNRNGIAGRIWSKLVKAGRNFVKSIFWHILIRVKIVGIIVESV